jgi:hypothetical protein
VVAVSLLVANLLAVGESVVIRGREPGGRGPEQFHQARGLVMATSRRPVPTG